LIYVRIVYNLQYYNYNLTLIFFYVKLLYDIIIQINRVIIKHIKSLEILYILYDIIKKT